MRGERERESKRVQLKENMLIIRLCIFALLDSISVQGMLITFLKAILVKLLFDTYCHHLY